ncbi:MAG: BON domain-containing protein [Verrucomicrobiota bacterium]
MRTFFIALFLGIFIGAIITAYFKTPEEFEEIFTPEKKAQIDEKLDRLGDKLEGYKEKIEEKLGKEGEEVPKTETPPQTDTDYEAPTDIEPVSDPDPPIEPAPQTQAPREDAEEPSVLDRISEKATDLFGSSADKRIKTNIISKLKLSGEVDIEAIEVLVQDGIVTLSGSIPSDFLANKVAILAQETKGVKEVIEDLNVAESN